jgi:hypothetical protein
MVPQAEAAVMNAEASKEKNGNRKDDWKTG